MPRESRGLEFDKGNIFQRMRNVIPIMVPLIAVTLNRSLDLAEAMDSRAYGATKKPTSLYHLTLKGADYAMLAIIFLGAAIGLYTTFYIKLF